MDLPSLTADRIVDCKAKAVLTCSAVMRANKRIELKGIADLACEISQNNGYQVGGQDGA